MPQIIQHKRSTGSLAPATLAQGELAFSKGSYTFYIGDPATSNTPLAIGPAVINDAGTPSLVGGVTALQMRAVFELDTSDNVEFNDVIVGGNLTVNGTTTTINTETLTVDSNVITLNDNYSGSSPSESASIEVERGTVANTALRWNESTNRWEFTNDGITYQNIPIPAEYDAGAGSVSSVDATVPTGLTVTGGPITSAGVLAFDYESGYSIPTTAKQGEWDTAFGWGDHAGLYATAAQGNKADTALQSITLSSTDGSITGVGASSSTTPSFDLEVGVIDGGEY